MLLYHKNMQRKQASILAQFFCNWRIHTISGSIFSVLLATIAHLFMCYFLRRRGFSMMFSAATSLHANFSKISSP